MSLLPGYFSARKRKDDSAPMTEPGTPSHEDRTHEDRPQDRAFDLVPPEPAADQKPPEDATPVAAEVVEPVEPVEPAAEAAEQPAVPEGRNVHTIGITDLSRLSIDRDGRLYWDGKPVEVRRRVMMSRAQILSAVVIGAFVMIGAVGAAINGTAAALDWACRIGWTTSYCGPTETPPPRPDIPA